MSVVDVFWYLVNGAAWFLAGMSANILVRSRKDRRRG